LKAARKYIRDKEMYKYKDIETTWENFPNILKNANSNLKIRITDPENVILGGSDVPGTLGYLISKYSRCYLVDFSPSDFSKSKYTAYNTSLFVGSLHMPESFVQLENNSMLLLINLEVEKSLGEKLTKYFFA
jgi:hypothetical protein